MVWIKQNDGNQSWIKQGLLWVFYVFTTEQVYSNNGSKVIVYGKEYWKKQNSENLAWVKQDKGNQTWVKQSDGQNIWTK